MAELDSSDNFGLEKLFISCTPIFETETMFRGSVVCMRTSIREQITTLSMASQEEWAAIVKIVKRNSIRTQRQTGIHMQISGN